MREFKRLLPKPAREDIAPEELDDYDFVVQRTLSIDYESFNTPARYYAALLNSPPLAAVVTRMGQIARHGQVRGSYTDAEREFVDVVLGTDMGYNSIFTVHLPDAIAVGVRPEAIVAVRSGNEQDLTEDEAQIASWTRQVVSGEVTDETWAEMVERFGERGLIEFTGFICLLQYQIRMWQVLGVPELSDEEIDELVDGLLDGSVEVPDPAARIG